MTGNGNEAKPAMSEDDQLKAAWSQLTLVLSFFSRIDTKLSVVLGLNLGMFAVLTSRITKVEDLHLLLVLLLVACLLLLTLSLFHLYKGAFPDLKGGTNSLVYFGNIAKLSEPAFVGAYRALSTTALVEDIHEQTWRNSKILVGKFYALQKSYQWTLAAVVPWLISLALVSTK
ncbi:MAG: hypothetical protein BGP24_22435 [Lysobacterales bacterium 69-70]|nr:hypothetical protein [Xanthomonadaceae bacterium]ODU36516.1 MAG: hypothetical protein ABS97_01155 [Xanthomonadaceae bacterium SCN 69-320]ODV17038.1 MAG: hypothetical protein ABT27_18250 [Xanthomonadaceae bacterium SCN 69-25]OJY96061.1 MAG: hypothetical protein BGP24_22435 [Xanthomonadales bacterium 69-70]